MRGGGSSASGAAVAGLDAGGGAETWMAASGALATNACRQSGHWTVWPKKSSGVATDLTDNVVRDTGLSLGLVDIKVCAIDDVWSGLKFVVPKAQRKKR